MFDTVNLLRLNEFKRDLLRMSLDQTCRKHVGNIRNTIEQCYFTNSSDHWSTAPRIIYGLALNIDSIIISLWKQLYLHLEHNLSLVAIGGYGRRELHPYSDIDMLIYYQRGKISEDVNERIRHFVRILWDSELKASVTMRPDRQIRKDCRHDIILATSLLEARTLIGDRRTARSLRQMIYQYWSTKKFFLAKRDEQRQRHNKYQNISYQLEPDIKNSPGGLRDLHTVIWIAKHLLRGTNFDQLVEEQLISHAGMRKLSLSRNFLWSMRLGVHLLSHRHEERFLIDYQRELATRLGFKDSTKLRAVEMLMQQYYKSVLAISAVSDSMMQKFEEIILSKKNRTKRQVNDNFYTLGNTLYCYDERCFETEPSNLLRCFVLLGKNSRIKKISASCIHAIYENSVLIDDDYRNNPLHRTLFMEILGLADHQAAVLELMKRYGVLGNYLPLFGKIIGQIQHDLFHIYTVDAHTLQTIRNVQNLLRQKQDKDLEIPAQVARQLPQFSTLVIAGLFHDIAKGRGGDHSLLGAVDVAEFAEQHGLSSYEVKLLSWLVKHHLHMSSVAQSKDLSDPQVIHAFAGFVDNKIRLDYLYVMTVADIMATNPSLWNSWRAALLTRLYLDTRSQLEEETTPTIETIIEDRQQIALNQFNDRDKERATELWQLLDNDFFVNKSPENLAWQTTQVLKYHNARKHKNVLVMIRPTHQVMSQGATEIAIYSRVQPMNFADIVYTLDRLNLDIQEARVHNTKDGFVFDSFIVLNQENKPLAKSAYAQVRDELESVFAILNREQRPGKSYRYIPPRVHKFWFEPQIQVHKEDQDKYQIQINCLDFPGLLTTITEVFRSLELEVITARITTIGEEARDRFSVQANKQSPDMQTMTKSMFKAIDECVKLTPA